MRSEAAGTAVVTDFTFPDLSVERGVLEPLGCRVVEGRGGKGEEFIRLTRQADYVIVQFAPVDAAVIAALERARIIVRYGVGVDNVDIEAARKKGIPVCNVPDYGVDEVADHAVALALALTRRLVPNADLVRGGKWGRATPIERMHALKDMTVGVAGWGRIGRQAGKRLAAFGCRLLVHDPVADPASIRADGAEPASVDRVLAESDLVTFHCPCVDATRGMLNRASIAKMKRGVLVVNVARGPIIDTEALMEGLKSGQIGGAGLDVTDPEPPPADHPLRRMENVIITSHLASYSAEAMRKLRVFAAEHVARAIRGEPLRNVVNGVAGPTSFSSPR